MVTVLYLLEKYLKVEVHERQMYISRSTRVSNERYVYFLCGFYYFKHTASILLG